MRKILVFGNSGSGKSTLAKQLSEADGMAHLDLDTLAWLPVIPPQRAEIAESQQKIAAFLAAHETWVIEGGYADLLDIVGPQASEIIFLNLDVTQCIENAKNRPWEPHKYVSKQAQDKNLVMLIDWIKAYSERDDVFSHRAHLRFYDGFNGKKTMFVNNARIPLQALKRD